MWKVQPFFPLLLLPCLACACLVCSLSPPGHTFLHCTQISMLVRQWLHVMEIIDFKCKSDPLGNKEKVCPCHFCSCRCHEQMSWCRSRASCSATRVMRSRTGTFQCWSQHKSCSQPSDLPPAMALSAQKCYPITDTKLCVITEPLLMRWQHTSLSLCFIPLFHYSMYKIMPYFLSSLAYISPLAQTADIHSHFAAGSSG